MSQTHASRIKWGDIFLSKKDVDASLRLTQQHYGTYNVLRKKANIMEYCCNSRTCSAFPGRNANKTKQKDNGDEADDEDNKKKGAKKGKKQDGTDNQVLQAPPLRQI